jgi:hypothetical protein
MLSAVCCLLSAVCCLLSAVCCLLSAVCCLLSAVCCLLSAAALRCGGSQMSLSFGLRWGWPSFLGNFKNPLNPGPEPLEDQSSP